jgi:hypothetical protein
MHNKILVFIVILFLVIIDLVFIMLDKGLSKNINLLQFKYNELSSQDSLNRKRYLENILQYSLNSGKKVNENIELISEDGQKTVFKRIAIARPVIIFKYFQESCNSCVESEFRIMKEVFSEENIQKIIVLTTEKYPDKILQFKRMNQINNHVYIISKEDLGLPVDKLAGPYMFVINDSNYIEDLFIPLKLISAPSVEYYKYIKRKYFEREEKTLN